MDREKQLELALRANRGRRLLPPFRHALEAALQSPLANTSFLALNGTDRLRERFSGKLAGSQSVYLPVCGYLKVVDALTSFAGRYGSTEAFLLHPIDDYTGAVWVPVGALLSHVEEVWNVVGEHFGLASEDAKNGLYVDANLTGHSGDGYEVVAWRHFEPLLAELRARSR